MFASNYIINWAETMKHIASKYPEEAGGIITREGLFVPLQNVAEDKINFYEIATSDWLQHCDNVRAILHSHTYDPNNPPEHDPSIPSKVDMQSQIDTGLEWALVVTDGVDVTEPVWWGDYDHRPPLMERHFAHITQDCLSFMRDWQYAEFGLKVPDNPREYDWFMTGGNLLEECYLPWGFVDVTDLPIERGDVIFLRIRPSTVPNHLGVVIDQVTFAHHPYGKGRFPTYDRTDKWDKYITRRVRHKTHPFFKGKKRV